MSGIDHGIFEVLQGNTAPPGLLFPAIGPAQRMWEYGTEDAFTLVPNHLVTGILAITLGTLTLAWSIGFLDRPQGSTGLLVLGLLTFAVGGGVGMLVFLAFGWAVARRIGQPARRMHWVPSLLRAAVARTRTVVVGLGLALYVFAVQVAITGWVPGIVDPDQVLVVCWSLLVAALTLFALALVGTGQGDDHRPEPAWAPGDERMVASR